MEIHHYRFHKRRGGGHDGFNGVRQPKDIVMAPESNGLPRRVRVKIGFAKSYNSLIY